MNNGNYTDIATAQQLGKVFPYILTSGVLSDLVAQFVVGQTEMILLDESGVPSDSGRTSITRGSVRKGAAAGLIAGILPGFRIKKRKKKEQRQVTILNHQQSQEYLEALRAVRTRVERWMENEHKKTLMITSSIPGEGKSTIAVNLAISLAQKGKKVILVDCNLRNPSVQDYLNIPGTYPGISNVLNGKEELEKALYTVENRNIDLKVFCGSHDSTQNVEILGSHMMQNLLDKLEKMADIVVLDTSPSAVLMDAVVLARYVPMAVYVVKYDHVGVRYVLKGIEELAETGVHILGCVINEGKYGTVQTEYSGLGRYSGYHDGYSRYYGSGRKRK